MTLAEKNGFTKDRQYGPLVTSLIRERYSIDDELALLNNYNANPTKNHDEYYAYQDYRSACKAKARKTLGI